MSVPAHYNEGVKLTAAWLNGMSLAIFAAGGFGPWITLANPTSHPEPQVLGVISIICIVTCIALHLTAKAYLGRMR